MEDKKDSTQGRPREGGQTDRKTKSRRKKRAPGPPPGSEREPKPVEDLVDSNISTNVATDSTSLPEEIEVPGRLTKRQIAAIQYDYRNRFTVEQIELLTGNSRATIYKYIRGIEQLQPTLTQNSTTAADPPPSSLSQPASSSTPSPPPPKIIEITDTDPTENDRIDPRETESERNGRRYEQYTSRQSQSRLPLPAVDQETIGQLLMLFGNDMMHKNFLDFADYFRQDVIPRFRTLEEWEAYIPGANSEERTRNLRRYLWIVSKFFEQIKSYEQFEAANNGVKQES